MSETKKTETKEVDPTIASMATPNSAPARAQTSMAVASSASTPSAPSIPAFRGSLLLDFGRLDSTYHRVDLAVSIDNQVSVAHATYQQMEQLCSMALPMDIDTFTRMWKTLILKRVQDIFEHEKHRRSEHFVRVMRNLLIPAPLADLLYALGQHHSRALGTIFDMIPPARPAVPQPWWTMDPLILDHWCLMCARMSKQFMMKEFPAPSEYKDRAIAMTSIQDAGNLRSVKSLTNEPTPADGYLRFVNDEILIAPFPFANSQLRIVEGLERPSILYSYVGAYVLDSNS